MTKKTIIILVGIILLPAVYLIFFTKNPLAFFFRPTTSNIEAGKSLNEIIETKSTPRQNNKSDQNKSSENRETEINLPDIEIISENLEIPWEIAFIEGQRLLVTERTGKLTDIENGKKKSLEVPGVKTGGEGGLLGLALHPDFKTNNWIYLYFSSNQSGENINKVVRYEFLEDSLNNEKVIIDNIPGAVYHDGGRIEFGPDGYLYITTGDATQPELAQDLNSLAGKILRLTDEGEIPDENPFNTAVYSYGHRNPQGLSWDSQDRLWVTEHGRSGFASGYDELNLIQPGENYGWPDIQGDQTLGDMQTPKIHSGPNETWAPADNAIIGNKIYFTGLRGEALYEAEITEMGEVENLKANLKEDFGRIRSVVVGPEKYLYISTSNRDGRGATNEGDDKIIRINPNALN